MASRNAPNQKLEEIFQCSVCKRVTPSKILQCPNGHLTCGNCSARITACPVCRTTLDPDMDKRIRALSAEQAIEAMDLNFECGNGDCTFSGLKKDLEEHEETCEDDDEYEDVDDSDEEPNQSLEPVIVTLTRALIEHSFPRGTRRLVNLTKGP